MSTVHVFAPPDHPQEEDSRLCSENDGGEVVIYHSDSVITEGGCWMCTKCNLHEDQLPTSDVIVSRVL